MFSFILSNTYLKFIYSEKARIFCEISTLLLPYVVPVKIRVKILQNIVAFSAFASLAHDGRTTLVTQEANTSAVVLLSSLLAPRNIQICSGISWAWLARHQLTVPKQPSSPQLLPPPPCNCSQLMCY